MDNYNKELENNLLEMVKQKEQADKRLLSLEILVGVMCVAILLSLIVVATYIQMEEWLKTLLVLIGMIPLLVAAPFMLKIEQTAGYYECKKCGHKFIPTYSQVFWAVHFGRSRNMKCPHCNQRSYCKKVIRK